MKTILPILQLFLAGVLFAQAVDAMLEGESIGKILLANASLVLVVGVKNVRDLAR